MKIEASIDVREITKHITGVRKRHIPFVTSLAINRTAQKVKLAEQNEIKDVFDRPTSYIKNSIFIKPSKKNNLSALVAIKDQAIIGNPATKILAAQIEGGQRRPKRYENALKAVGALPDGYYTVPGQGAPIDSFGNIPGSFIVKLLSYFSAFPEAGYKANSTEETRAKAKKGTKKKLGFSYVVMQINNQLGIWERRHASKMSGPVKPIKPILMFMPTTNYEKTFDFDFVARTTIDRNYKNEFSKAWEFAKATEYKNI